jgi:polyferredoxin
MSASIEPLIEIKPLRRTQPRKKLGRRAAADYSQALRRTVQTVFVALNLYLGWQFVRFVHYFETGTGIPVERPAGVEGWLPIAALMNLKYALFTGSIPAIHPAAMFLLVSFLAISVLFRKAFCSWLCPVGTLSEMLWKMGRRIFRTNLTLPRWLDIPLRSLKYILLGLFLYAVGSMPVPALQAFLSGPYGIVADVKMLNFFRFMSTVAAVVLGALVVLSILIQNFWCRYLCPYGALMGLAALFSPAKIRRNPDLCIDCNKCAKACPALLPVDQLLAVRSAECTACLECVAVCPAAGALELQMPRRRRIPAWALAVGVAVIFFGVVGYAKWAGVWQTNVAGEVYRELIPHATEFSHP